MSKYYFPGFPAFFKGAAEFNHLPELVGRAQRCPTIAAMANLCAQAVEADAKDVAEILAKASDFLDQLAVAHEAAKLMLEAVREGLDGRSALRGPEPPEPGALIPKGMTGGGLDRA